MACYASGWTTSLAVSPDGKLLALPSSNAVHLLDARTGREVGLLRGHGNGQVMAVGFGPDGKRAVTGGWDRTAKIWDIRQRKQTADLTDHTQRVAGVAFDPARDRIPVPDLEGLTGLDFGRLREFDAGPG